MPAFSLNETSPRVHVDRLLIAAVRLLLRRVPHESEDILLARISRPLRLLVLALTVQAGGAFTATSSIVTGTNCCAGIPCACAQST